MNMIRDQQRWCKKAATLDVIILDLYVARIQPRWGMQLRKMDL